MTNWTPSEYKTPPLKEVACGISYQPISNFKIPHYGLLWEKFNREDYPKCEHAPVILSSNITESATEILELPRIWFIHENQNDLIQIQTDKFLQNWRKMSDDDVYPRFNHIFSEFINNLEIFSNFIDDEKLGQIAINSCELTYVNHILIDENDINIKSLDDIFSDIHFNENSNLFLPEPAGFNLTIPYVMSNKADILYAKIKDLRNPNNKNKLIVFELTVKGGDEKTIPELADWFSSAHEWIIRSFDELTEISLQKTAWGLQPK